MAELDKKSRAERPSGNVSRRHFLRGASAAALALPFLPSSKVDAQTVQLEMHENSVQLDESITFRVERLEKILRENRKVKDLQPEELLEMARLCQHIFKVFTGMTFQGRMRQAFRIQLHPDIQVVVSKNRLVPPPETGAFFHSQNPDLPNRVLLHENVPAQRLLPVLFHELVHGAFGTGEGRADFLATLAQMYAYAKISPTFALQQEAHALRIMLHLGERERFLRQRSFTERERIRIWLPMKLMAEFRDMRGADVLRSLRQFLPLANTRNDAELLAIFHADTRDGAWHQYDKLQVIADKYLREAAYLLRHFNPNVTLPPALQSYSS